MQPLDCRSIPSCILLWPHRLPLRCPSHPPHPALTRLATQSVCKHGRLRSPQDHKSHLGECIIAGWFLGYFQTFGYPTNVNKIFQFKFFPLFKEQLKKIWGYLAFLIVRESQRLTFSLVIWKHKGGIEMTSARSTIYPLYILLRRSI